MVFDLFNSSLLVNGDPSSSAFHALVFLDFGIGGKIGFYYKDHEILPPLPGGFLTFSCFHSFRILISSPMDYYKYSCYIDGLDISTAFLHS